MSKVKRAFTLIELLVVIAIIAILAAILFPVFTQAKEMAKKTACIANHKQLVLSTIMYTDDSDGVYPIGEGNNRPSNTVFFVHDLTSPYRKSVEILQCPSYPKSPRGQDWAGNPRTNDYAGSMFQYVRARWGNVKTPGSFRHMAYTWNWGLFGMVIDLGLSNKWRPLSEGAVPAPADTIAFMDGFMPRKYNITETTGGWIDYWYKYEMWPRHVDGMPISFIDGHVKFYRYNGMPKGGAVTPGCTNYTGYGARPNYYDFIIRVPQAKLNSCGIKRYPATEDQFECVGHPGSSPNFGDFSGVPGTCVADVNNL